MSLSLVSPFPAYAWPSVWEWIRPFKERVSDDFGPQTLDDFVEFSVERARNAKTWAVFRDGEMGGLISIEHMTPVVVSSHVVFKRSFWGEGTVSAAMRQ